MRKLPSGFTLIEVLVAMSIVTVLSFMAITIYRVALQKARDTKRMADLKDTATYLQLYHKQNGRFPDSIAEAGCSGWEKGSNAPDNGFIQPLLTSGIIDRPLPIEKTPLTACSYRYIRSACGSSTYAVLAADLETDSGQDDVRPTAFDSCAGTWPANPASPGSDKRDWAIFLLE